MYHAVGPRFIGMLGAGESSFPVNRKLTLYYVLKQRNFGITCHNNITQTVIIMHSAINTREENQIWMARDRGEKYNKD